MKRIIVKPGEEKRLLAGHPWVYDNEVSEILDFSSSASLIPGELADVESSKKQYIGRAFVNPNSKIIARIYSPSKIGVDRGFFKKRIRDALRRRSLFYRLAEESQRIVFAEADFLPALIVDRYVGWPLADAEKLLASGTKLSFEAMQTKFGPPRSWLTMQCLSYGMDQRKDELVHALDELLSVPLNPDSDFVPGVPDGIIERNEARVRELEGLPLQSGLLRGNYPEEGILFFENSLPFSADLMGGQKTGHFLDQRDNRRLAASFAQGRRVLDMCCHTGGFSVHAARSGAASVRACDVSDNALNMLRKNAALNNVSDTIEPMQGDIFELLKRFEREKESFDLVILDPPAFAKSHTALSGALRGYKEINLKALKLLDKGGILVSCSCSHAMTEAHFKHMIADAAADAGRRVQLLDFRYQAPDHPVLVGYDESLYLKCAFYLLV